MKVFPTLQAEREGWLVQEREHHDRRGPGAVQLRVLDPGLVHRVPDLLPHRRREPRHREADAGPHPRGGRRPGPRRLQQVREPEIEHHGIIITKDHCHHHHNSTECKYSLKL